MSITLTITNHHENFQIKKTVLQSFKYFFKTHLLKAFSFNHQLSVENCLYKRKIEYDLQNYINIQILKRNIVLNFFTISIHCFKQGCSISLIVTSFLPGEVIHIK